MEEENKPDPAFIAQQLRKPSGKEAEKIGDKMDVVNEPLFNLTLNTMQLKDGEHVLELGFGSGKYIERLFSRARWLQVDGIDYSKEMVDRAKRNNKPLIDSGQLKLAKGETKKLPFNNASFDKVYCNMVIFFWDQPDDHLKEIYRVLKPGGKFYTGIRTKESMRQFPFIEHGFLLYDPEEWIVLLRRNGFEYEEVKKSSDPFFEEEDKTIRLESICIVARKRINSDLGQDI